MRRLAIDIETYSSVDLKKAGVHKYVESPDFEVLLIGYKFIGRAGDVHVVEPRRVSTEALVQALIDPTLMKTAFNAGFERVCLSKCFGVELPPEQWECTMVRCASLGLPISLEQAAKALKISEQKDTAGRALLRYFTVPCGPTKANGMRTRNEQKHAPEKWEAFRDYCAQDVRTEIAIREALDAYPQQPASEHALWCLDQRINDRGFKLDAQLIKSAMLISTQHTEDLMQEAIKLTGLDNPNSGAQLKAWLSAALDTEISTLSKDTIPALLKDAEDDATKRVLAIRKEFGRTSVKKFMAMDNVICQDDRARGQLQFYGASRTGRWSGRQVQPQNLRRNDLKDLALAREVVREGDIEMLQMLYANVPDVLSQLIRTAIVASDGCMLHPADFSSIEARVIAWLAGEKWRLDVFKSHGKIYEASAAQMFKVPLESIDKKSPLRQRGKVAELALGYQGGVNALIQMGALEMGISEDELPGLVSAWRKASPNIVRLWNTIGAAAIEALDLPGKLVRCLGGVIKFQSHKGALLCFLPSGRFLCYQKARIVPGKFGGSSLRYDGMNQTTKVWGPQDTYGGKLVENIVQAIARDCMAEAMMRLDEAGFPIVLTVHDEVVIDCPKQEDTLSRIDAIMSAPVQWAKDLPLTADSYSTPYYMKD